MLPVDATVTMPGSKSLAARWLVLLGDPVLARATLSGLPDGDDTQTMVTALETMPSGRVDAGRAGTVLRFLLPQAAAGRVPVTFTGDAQLAARPLAPLVAALRSLGAHVDADRLPLTVTPGPQAADDVTVDAAASSQVVSGLLLAAPRFPRGLTLSWGDAPSGGHIAMTLRCLDQAGIAVERLGARRVRVAPGVPAVGARVVEPDLPAAAPFLLAAALLGGRVDIAGWPEDATQDSPELRAVLEAWGCDIGPGWRVSAPGPGDASPAPRPADASRAAASPAQRPADASRTAAFPAPRPAAPGEARTAPPGGRLRALPGLDMNLSGHAELLPVIGAAAALASEPSRLTGLAHARGHESDRVAALAADLTAIGTDVEQGPDHLVIRPRPTHPATWRTFGDHRLVMAGALAALGTPGLVLDDPTPVTKTYPAFLDDWSAMIGQARP